MEGLIPPSALNMDSVNLPKSWKAWKEEFTLYLELAMPEAEETTRVKLFYYLIGEKGRELCNTLRGENTKTRTTVKKLIEMLDEHCSPKVNETVERYRFFVRNQGQENRKTPEGRTVEEVHMVKNYELKDKDNEISCKCKVKVRNPRNQKLYRLEFQVVDQKCGIPLLGRNASEGMKLIRVQYENILAIDSIVKKEESEGGQWTLEEIMTEFKDVFTGDGCLQGEYVIEIDKTVQPVKLTKRRVPVAMMKPLKEELADLE
ncbi:hypothetical protein SRHO_G00121350 [Serrasalmus rhombeus]